MNNLVAMQSQDQDALLSKGEEGSNAHRYGFKINNLGLTYPTDMPAELINTPHVCSIPHAPKGVQGVINVRGHLVPVFDLNILLYDANKPITSHLFLVLGKGSSVVAIRINDFPVLLGHVQEGAVGDAVYRSCQLPVALQAYINTYFYTDAQVWLELDLVAFFSALK